MSLIKLEVQSKIKIHTTEAQTMLYHGDQKQNTALNNLFDHKTDISLKVYVMFYRETYLFY